MCSRIGFGLLFTNKTDKHMDECDEREETNCEIILTRTQTILMTNVISI